MRVKSISRTSILMAITLIAGGWTMSHASRDVIDDEASTRRKNCLVLGVGYSLVSCAKNAFTEENDVSNAAAPRWKNCPIIGPAYSLISWGLSCFQGSRSPTLPSASTVSEAGKTKTPSTPKASAKQTRFENSEPVKLEADDEDLGSSSDQEGEDEDLGAVIANIKGTPVHAKGRYDYKRKDGVLVVNRTGKQVSRLKGSVTLQSVKSPSGKVSVLIPVPDSE